MATPPSDETRSLFKLLGDREWHRYEDVLNDLAATVPPGKAVRRYEDRLIASREFRGDNKTEIVLSETEQIELGARAIAQTTISSWKGRGIIQRGDSREEKEIRIKPGFRTWGLSDLIRPEPTRGEDGAPTQTPEEGGGYTDLQGRGSEPPVTAAGTAEVPLELAADPEVAHPIVRINGYERYLGDAVPGYVFEPPADEPPSQPPTDEPPVQESDWIPQDDADYRWGEQARSVTGDEPAECGICGLAVIDQQLHDRWHEAQSQALREQPMALVDEVTLRTLVSGEIGQCLDRFQDGMQQYLSAQFAQLDERIRALKTPQNQSSRWRSR